MAPQLGQKRALVGKDLYGVTLAEVGTARRADPLVCGFVVLLMVVVIVVMMVVMIGMMTSAREIYERANARSGPMS